MPRVVHFELGCHDPERAAQFYTEVFGWKFQKWEGSGPMEYWLIQTGEESEPGINGGMHRIQEAGPVTNAYVIGVDALDEYVAKIGQSGGKIRMPKSAIPEVGYFASFEDTEGNTVSLMEPDPNAR